MTVKKVELRKPARVNTHFKTCRRCGENFRTLAKYGKICEDCNVRLKVNKNESFK